MSYNTNKTYGNFKEALEFAKKKHNGQRRENGDPYINHPIKVAELVRKYFSDYPEIDRLIISAYLHDTLEDTDTTIDELRMMFGDSVANLVMDVTSDDELKHKMGKANYLCYKMLNMNDDALNLKLCDRLANTLDLVNASHDFQEKYMTETLIIMNYLLNNRSMTDIQLEIVKEINKKVSELRKRKILKLVDSFLK